MISDASDNVPRVRPGPIKWLNHPLRDTLERAAGRFFDVRWKIHSERDFSEFACHPAGIVSDGSLAVFFKYRESNQAPRQFQAEMSGLKTLRRRAGVRTPDLIGVEPVDSGWLLIMTVIEAVEREPNHWREMGRTLARIHLVAGEGFGSSHNGFWGPLPQDNTVEPDWISFYRDRRLVPLLKISVDSGNLPTDIVPRIDDVIRHLSDLGSPEVVPVLLHGDAQQNNFISSSEGTYVIDPAVFYGHPEWDLALLDAFQPVPEDVFDGYREALSIASGFSERRHLWRLPLYLAAVALEGRRHLNRLTDALAHLDWLSKV